MIREISGRSLAFGAILWLAADARAWQAPSTGTRRGMPEAPALAPPSPAPGLGPSPGALDPSPFSPDGTAIIGGRARGGTGRVPRRAVRPQPIPDPTRRAPGPLALPSSSPDASPSDSPDDPDDGPAGGLVEDAGAPDGLTLDAAIDRMMASNLDLLALRYEIPQADADILTAGLRANPLIYTDAQLIPYGNYKASRPVGPTEYDISITYPIDLSRKRPSRVKVSRAAKSAIEAQLQDAVRRQIGNLYKSFVDLQAARLDVLTGEAAVRDQERALAQAGRRAGNEKDVSRLEDQLAKARDALDDARDSLDDAREAVGLLLNLPPEEASRLQPRGGLRVVAPPPPPLEELTRLALATRPDLIAARRGITRAASEVQLARATRFDDVFLFYDPYSYQDNRISNQPSGRSWAIGMTVPLPIYNRNQGNIARACGNLTQTQVELSALERRIVSEVRLADREYRNSRQSVEKAERTTRSKARQDRAKAAAEFAAGSITLADYLGRLDDDNDAAKGYRDALVRHRRSMLDLNSAVGIRLVP
jgi:cobalt-zinc-cadmium efflux system outer membrane protein